MTIPKLDWLEVYSKEELRSFLEELICQLKYDFKQSDDELGRELASEERWMITIYEWWQSAIAIQNPELEKGFEDETEEVTLTMPAGNFQREVYDETIYYINKKITESCGKVFADLEVSSASERQERSICRYQGA